MEFRGRQSLAADYPNRVLAISHAIRHSPVGYTYPFDRETVMRRYRPIFCLASSALASALLAVGAPSASATPSTLLNSGLAMWDNLGFNSNEYLAAAFTSDGAGTISEASIEVHGNIAEASNTSISFYTDPNSHPTSAGNLLGTLTFASSTVSGWGHFLHYSGSVFIPSAGTYWMKFSIGTVSAGVWVHMGTGASSTPWTAASGPNVVDINGVFANAIGSAYYPAIKFLGTPGGGGASTPNPTPPPVYEPSPPTTVAATPLDGSVEVTWNAPASSGSYPVSTYLVQSSPGGRICLTAALTCSVTGLSNGTPYTFTVRALNGAGWSPPSEPSSSVTPRAVPKPSITIIGHRLDGERIMVLGTTTGFAMGAILRPWIRFPGQTSYTQGTASILVDAQGGFTWQRRTGKTIYISIRSEDGTVESNRLILRTT